MYAITMRGWITILERDILTPFSLETSLAGSHKKQNAVTNARQYGNSFCPSAASTPYDDTPKSRSRLHDIISMDVQMQEKYLIFTLDIMQKVLCSLLWIKFNRKSIQRAI